MLGRGPGEIMGVRISVSPVVVCHKAVGIIHRLSEIGRVMRMACFGDDVWWDGSSKEGVIRYRKGYGAPQSLSLTTTG